MIRSIVIDGGSKVESPSAKRQPFVSRCNYPADLAKSMQAKSESVARKSKAA